MAGCTLTVWDDTAVNLVTDLFRPVIAELGLTAVLPPGPDSQRFAEEREFRRLLAVWQDVSVQQVRWSVRVQPGAWFDAIANSTPRTCAVLAQASPRQRDAAREQYIRLAMQSHGHEDGFAVLPAAAVLVSAVKPL